MVKLKQALDRGEEQLSLSSRRNFFNSSTSLQSTATARVAPRPDDRTEAGRQEREATPEINFAESDRRNSDESPAGRKERPGNVVVGKFTSTPPHHPFSVSPAPYLLANETLDGRTLMDSYMKHVASKNNMY